MNKQALSISQEEIERLAKLSGLTLTEDEKKVVTGRLTEILTYIEQINRLELGEVTERVRNINVFREDKVVPSTQNEQILKCCAQKDNEYFVVPRMIKQD